MSSLSRRVRLLPQSAGVTADDAFPAFAGLTPVLGVVQRSSVESCDKAHGSIPAHCRPRRAGQVSVPTVSAGRARLTVTPRQTTVV